MVKYNKQIFIILVSMILITFLISSNVFATEGTLVDQFDKKISTSGTGADEVKTKAGQIVGVIQVVGTITSFGMMIFIGIKYILGSANEKAEYKKTMIPYIVGAVLIFGFSNITQIIYKWVQTF